LPSHPDYKMINGVRWWWWAKRNLPRFRADQISKFTFAR